MDPTFRYTGVCDEITAGAGFHQMIQWEPSSGFGNDDDEQIVQCLEQVRIP
jgi:hypothetical protein